MELGARFIVLRGFTKRFQTVIGRGELVPQRLRAQIRDEGTP